MALKFLSKHTVTENCAHEATMRIEVAGMSRDVCESCGKVTLGYIEVHYQPDRIHEIEEVIRSFHSDSDR